MGSEGTATPCCCAFNAPPRQPSPNSQHRRLRCVVSHKALSWWEYPPQCGHQTAPGVCATRALDTNSSRQLQRTLAATLPAFRTMRSERLRMHSCTCGFPLSSACLIYPYLQARRPRGPLPSAATAGAGRRGRPAFGFWGISTTTGCAVAGRLCPSCWPHMGFSLSVSLQSEHARCSMAI